jgi:hypothetical protein
MIKALCVVAIAIILVARVNHPGTPPTETSVLITETDGVEVWRDGGLVYVRSDARLMAPAFGEERLEDTCTCTSSTTSRTHPRPVIWLFVCGVTADGLTCTCLYEQPASRMR